MRGYLASHFFNDAMYKWTEEVGQYIENNSELVRLINDFIDENK